MISERMEKLENEIKEVIKQIRQMRSPLAVIDNNCVIFVDEAGEQIEMCGRDALWALCLALGVEIDRNA